MRQPAERFVELSPADTLTPQAQALPVRWTGGINRIEASEEGRQCFVMLYATFGKQQTLQWPSDGQQFVACGTAGYDPELVAQFTLVTFNGRVNGQRMLMGKPVPVIEIDALYRHSDCLSTSENAGACYSGYLEPHQP